jgi:hypothetical protein
LSVVTSIRILGAATGLALPLAAAIALYWAGGTQAGLIGFLFTIALLGIPLGALSGAAFAPEAMRTTRPILLAGKATFKAVLVGFIAYAVILVVSPTVNAGLDADSTIEGALALLIFLSWGVLGAWAFAMPYALLGVLLLRRVGGSGVSLRTLASTSTVLLICALATGVHALSSSGA